DCRAAKTISRAPAAGLHVRRKCSCGGTGSASSGCRQFEKTKRVLRLPMGLSQGALGAVPVAVTRSLDTPGQPLDGASRTYFEPRFAHDFSRVRVHADSQAEEAAASIGARAFAVGRHIVFGRGEYPSTDAANRHVLDHELTHLIQQEPAERASHIE